MTKSTIPFRLAAWIYVAALILFTIAPPSARPDSACRTISNILRVFSSLEPSGIMGHPRNLLLCLTLTVLFAGGLELLQLWVPGRHVRVH